MCPGFLFYKESMNFELAIYEHAVKLIEKTPGEVSRSKDLMVQGHKTAYEKYGPLVGIDS